MTVPSKPLSWSKQSASASAGAQSSAAERDPKITPWMDDEALETTPSPHSRTRGRSMRDWIVLGLAFLLMFYVALFLLGGFSSSSTSSSSSSGFSFGGASEVAIIPIQGEIASYSSKDTTGFPEIISALEEAEADPAVGVIFLDIDSGGGSVVASKQVVSKIRLLEKPVMSWIGDVGASGAYYIASATDYATADADSITGSIGVISMQPTLEELMQKVGVKMNTVKTGELKDIGSPFNEFTDEEKQIMQMIVDEAFESFKNDVVAFRGEKINPTLFADVLDGRILSGRQALNTGLIDATLTREEALVKAGEMMGIEGKPSVRYYLEKELTIWDLLFSAGASFGKGISSSVAPISSAEQAGIRAE